MRVDATLLRSLGYRRHVHDERMVVFINKPIDSLFLFPNVPPKTVARDSDVVHVRSQLYWRGLMEKKEFDARFGRPELART